jgi:hypothetical protein
MTILTKANDDSMRASQKIVTLDFPEDVTSHELLGSSSVVTQIINKA